VVTGGSPPTMVVATKEVVGGRGGIKE